MKKQGTITRWNADRGFGFLRSPGTPADVFFHIRDFRGADTPSLGLAVTFEEIQVGGKGPRAMAVTPVDATPRPQVRRTPDTTRRSTAASPTRKAGQPRGRRSPSVRDAPATPVLLLMLVWATLLGWGVWAGRLPMWVLLAAPLLNLVTFFIYWTDKHAAQHGRWRTREDRLHGLALLGGWPGAWAAHQILRHKSRKADFRAMYWATVVLHCAALGGWLFWLRPAMG
jgi:uncharacterized membrane protein YsdA (DUF1294 family)/cold shock CspA family protein